MASIGFGALDRRSSTDLPSIGKGVELHVLHGRRSLEIMLFQLERACWKRVRAPRVAGSIGGIYRPQRTHDAVKRLPGLIFLPCRGPRSFIHSRKFGHDEGTACCEQTNDRESARRAASLITASCHLT